MDLAQQKYDKRKFNLAVLGLTMAVVSSIANATFPIFNSTSMSMVTESMGVGEKLMALYIVTLITVALGEIVGGIITVIYNRVQGGYQLSEYKRVLSIPISRTILISAILGGPIGTACNMIATTMCGVTYVAVIIGLTPALSAILGRVFLKEKLGARCVLGIIIIVAGIIITCLAPPEGAKNFYLGLAIACACPLAFAGENIISTNAVDVADPRTACPVYRMFGAALLELLIAFAVALMTGHIDIFATAFTTLFTIPRAVLFLVIGAVFMAIQYNCTYTAYTYCGAVRAGSILFAYSAFTIPVGMILAGFGVAEYSISILAIISTAITIVGIVLVIGNPKDLFTLRDKKE